MNSPLRTTGGESGSNPWQPRVARIVEITPEISGVSTYRLAPRDQAGEVANAYRPGQFHMLYLPGYGEVAISVSGAADDGHLLHTVRTAGNVTRRLAELRAGDEIGVRGPFGTSWPIDDCEGLDVAIVAGGIGLAPLRPVLTRLVERRERFGRCTLIVGARSPDMLLFQRQYETWREAGINVVATVDRATTAWTGAVGVATLIVDRFQPCDPQRTAMFVCGPDVMMKFVLASAAGRGLPLDRIWLSLERNMQCAVGLCGHCQYGPAFVCKDGPVLRADRIEPLLHVAQL